MLRLTPVRVLYLIIGMVIGAAVFFAYTTVAGTPAFLTSVARSAHPTATVAPTAPAVFSGKALTRVRPVNQQAARGGVALRINSLEEYSDGFSLTYSILGGQPGEPAPVLQPERFALTDDRGTIYELSPLGSSATVAPGLSTGYLAFQPALARDANTLTVTVPHLLVVSNAARPGEPRVVDGPWQIEVPLR